MALPFPYKTLTPNDVDQLKIRLDCDSLAIAFKRLSACSVSSKFIVPLCNPCTPTFQHKLSHAVNKKLGFPKDKVWYDFCLGGSHSQSINVMYSDTDKVSNRKDFLKTFFGFTNQLDNFNESVYHGAKAYDPNTTYNEDNSVTFYRQDFEKLAILVNEYLEGEEVLFYKTAHGLIDGSEVSVKDILFSWRSHSCDEADIILVQIHKACIITPPNNRGVLLFKYAGLNDVFGPATKSRPYGIKHAGYFYGFADKPLLTDKNISYVQAYNILTSGCKEKESADGLLSVERTTTDKN